jgi:hypothetical protein
MCGRNLLFDYFSGKIEPLPALIKNDAVGCDKHFIGVDA